MDISGSLKRFLKSAAFRVWHVLYILFWLNFLWIAFEFFYATRGELRELLADYSGNRYLACLLFALSTVYTCVLSPLGVGLVGWSDAVSEIAGRGSLTFSVYSFTTLVCTTVIVHLLKRIRTTEVKTFDKCVDLTGYDTDGFLGEALQEGSPVSKTAISMLPKSQVSLMRLDGSTFRLAGQATRVEDVIVESPLIEKFTSDPTNIGDCTCYGDLTVGAYAVFVTCSHEITDFEHEHWLFPNDGKFSPSSARKAVLLLPFGVDDVVFLLVPLNKVSTLAATVAKPLRLEGKTNVTVASAGAFYDDDFDAYRSSGVLTEDELFGGCRYSGSTLPGFSGSGYYSGGGWLGMHRGVMCGRNVGFLSRYLIAVMHALFQIRLESPTDGFSSLMKRISQDSELSVFKKPKRLQWGNSGEMLIEYGGDFFLVDADDSRSHGDWNHFIDLLGEIEYRNGGARDDDSDRERGYRQGGTWGKKHADDDRWMLRGKRWDSSEESVDYNAKLDFGESLRPGHTRHGSLHRRWFKNVGHIFTGEASLPGDLNSKGAGIPHTIGVPAPRIQDPQVRENRSKELGLLLVKARLDQLYTIISGAFNAIGFKQKLAAAMTDEELWHLTGDQITFQEVLKRCTEIREIYNEKLTRVARLSEAEKASKKALDKRRAKLNKARRPDRPTPTHEGLELYGVWMADLEDLLDQMRAIVPDGETSESETSDTDSSPSSDPSSDYPMRRNPLGGERLARVKEWTIPAPSKGKKSLSRSAARLRRRGRPADSLSVTSVESSTAARETDADVESASELDRVSTTSSEKEVVDLNSKLDRMFDLIANLAKEVHAPAVSVPSVTPRVTFGQLSTAETCYTNPPVSTQGNISPIPSKEELPHPTSDQGFIPVSGKSSRSSQEDGEASRRHLITGRDGTRLAAMSLPAPPGVSQENWDRIIPLRKISFTRDSVLVANGIDPQRSKYPYLNIHALPRQQLEACYIQRAKSPKRRQNSSPPRNPPPPPAKE
nr:MAG: peptidase S39 [Chemarfal virus 255]